MLLALTNYLSEHLSIFSVFQYLTFRTMVSTVTALGLSLLLGPRMISKLQQHQVGQVVRDDGPETHLTKAGTPTMGGGLILAALVATTLLWCDLTNRYVWIVIGVTLAFGAVGWVDDYLKITRRHPGGLRARWKYLWQSVFGFAAAVVLFAGATTPQETALIVPIFKQVAIPLGIGFVVVAYFVIVFMSNAVNLTDGLDGLAILPTAMVGGALGLIAYVAGHAEFADYLQIPHIAGAGELAVFCGALIGAGLGFLWFNTYAGPGVHGRRGRARARRGTWRRRRHRPARDRAAHHGRPFRAGGRLGGRAGCLVQAHRQARLPHGAHPPPFRALGLAGAARDRAPVDRHPAARAGGAGDPEAALKRQSWPRAAAP